MRCGVVLRKIEERQRRRNGKNGKDGQIFVRIYCRTSSGMTWNCYRIRHEVVVFGDSSACIFVGDFTKLSRRRFFLVIPPPRRCRRCRRPSAALPPQPPQDDAGGPDEMPALTPRLFVVLRPRTDSRGVCTKSAVCAENIQNPRRSEDVMNHRVYISNARSKQRYPMQ